MKTLVWLAVGLCAAALLGVVLLLCLQEPGAPALVAPKPEDPASRGAAAASRDADRPPDSQRVATESRDAPAEAVIHGRCLAAESGAPLAGCDVRLRRLPRGDAATREAAAQAWRDPAPLVTGADGVFQFAFTPPSSSYVALAVRSVGRCTMIGLWPDLAAGQEVDLGDLMLCAGTRIAGRVVDTKGSPAAGIAVTLSRPSSRPPGAFGLRERLVATSQSDGTLEFGQELASPGEWTVTVRGEEELAEPKSLTLRAGQAQARLDVVVRRPDPKDVLAGTVVDETGSPVADMTVTAHPSGLQPDQPMYCTTGADGGFAIRRRGQAGEPVFLSGWSDTRAYEALHETRTFRWGTIGIRLTVRHAGAIEVFVVDAETGRPVADFAVFCFPEGSGTRLRSPYSSAPHHDGGRATVPGVGLGRNYLLVLPKDPALLPGEPVFFTRAEAGTPPLRVALEHVRALHVRVVRADGSPVAGTKLELVRHWGPESSSENVTMSSEGTMKRLPGARSIGVVLAEGTTDDAGRAELAGSGSGGELTLKVLGPGHVPRVVEHVQVTVEPLTVVVVTGATLRGTVAPVSALRRTGRGAAGDQPDAGPGLRLFAAGRTPPWFPATDLCPIAADGAFTLAGIPPGSWKAHLVCPAHENQIGSESRPLGMVEDLRDGEAREVRLDASAMVPGRLRGTILVDSAPWASSAFWLERALPDARGGRFPVYGTKRFDTDAQGRFELELHPGFHRLLVVLPRAAGGNEIRLQSDPWLWLAPGQELEQVLDLMHRRAVVRILASDGVTPVPGRKFHAQDAESFREATTDGEGVLVIDPAPARLLLSTFPPELDAADPPLGREERERRRIRLEPIEFAAGQRELRCDRRLPAAK